jgi:hypothetical protein
MSSLTFAEIEDAARQMGTYGDFATHYVPKTPEAESNKFKKMTAPAPRTSRVETLLANVVNLKNIAIKWVKETLPQKLAILRFNIDQKKAVNALQESIASKNFDEKVEKFKEFLEFDLTLMEVWERDSRLPNETINPYINKLREIAAQDFSKLDNLVGALYNTCTDLYTEAKGLQELASVHQSLCRFLHFYAKSDERQKTVFSQSRYCRFNT